SKLGLEWYTAKFNKILLEIEDHFDKYRISDALMATYKLVWDDYSSWLLEIIKPAYLQPIDRITFDAVIDILEQNLKLLPPFMPFLTEELWQHIAKRSPEEALVIAKWPEARPVNGELITGFEFASEVVSGIRTIRKEKQIPMKESLELSVLNEGSVSKDWDKVIAKLTNISNISYVGTAVEGALAFRVNSNEYFIPMVGAIDIKAEIDKLQEEL